MIDLTPLDVRKKRGDFNKGLRGYDPDEVDSFLEMVAERMEELVKENIAFRKKVGGLKEKVEVQGQREQAVQDALVTVQELRRDVKKQATREARVLEHEARTRIEAMITASGNALTERRAALEELERQRERFLKAFRTFLERELDTVEVEFGRAPLEDVTVGLDLGKIPWSIGPDDDGDSDGAEEDGADEDGASQDGEDGEDDEVGDDGKADDVAAAVGDRLLASDSAEDAGIVEPSEDPPLSSVTSDQEDEDAD